MQFVLRPLTLSVPQHLPSLLKAAMGIIQSKGHTDVITVLIVLYVLAESKKSAKEGKEY